ncbi:hypothetical protein [Streptomyces axinellae]|uniref:Integral membrane protein n=1 Tax=Streptomyces axinellae TaxID=552788 RepID=A0ABP6C7H1_9ACTN
MEKYIWAAAVGAEAAYVLSVLLGESISLLLHRRVTNFERRLHELPDERYFSGFMTPLLGSLAGGLAGGYTVSQIGEGGRSALTGAMFTALIIVILVRHQYQEVTGRRPRPVARARWRGRAAEIARVLSEQPMPVGRARASLRERAEELGKLGTRVADRANARTWRGALFALPRRQQSLLVASIALPVALAIWPASQGVSVSSLPAYAGLLALSPVAVAAHTLRWWRTRRALIELGHELSGRSRSLMQQIERTTPPRPRPLRIRTTSSPLQTGRRARR